MIADNIKSLEENIQRFCDGCGRKREEIKLVAVSKTKPPEDISQAFGCGIIHFGENKAQELRDKSREVREKVVWHFVGHLQTNKVKYVVNSADYIHSVDSLRLAEEIQKKAAGADKHLKLLLEIKTSEEATKYGLTEVNEILEILDFCGSSEYLTAVGLMTMAPYSEDEDLIRNCFKKTADLMNDLNRKGHNLSELSMGMTGDYKIAIEEGATILRIGTAIFGERNY